MKFWFNLENDNNNVLIRKGSYILYKLVYKIK